MKDCEFSEKMFENYFNIELYNKSKYYLYIPSQHDEKKEGVDAIFEDGKTGRKMYLLQYKICQQYIREPKNLDSPAFKFELHKDRKTKQYDQHNILVEMEKKGLKAGYLVPSFISTKLLNFYLKGDCLTDNVLLIKSNTKISDSDSHYINYDYKNAFQHSKSSEPCNVIKPIMEELDDAKEITRNELVAVFKNDNNKNKDYYEIIHDGLLKANAILIYK